MKLATLINGNVQSCTSVLTHGNSMHALAQASNMLRRAVVTSVSYVSCCSCTLAPQSSESSALSRSSIS
jgi:hypothetical protein